MKGFKAVFPLLGGAVAGAVVALIISSGSTTTTVTDQVVAKGVPASLSKTGTSALTKSSGSRGLTVNQVYRQDSPGVVDIEVTAQTKGSGTFGQPTVSQDEGSGVVYDKRGYILTDEHVVANATKVVVDFKDGYSATAKVIGTNASSDLGVIKVDVPQSQLHPIPFANSTSAQVGDQVVAIGSPFGQKWTTTAGIVSATGRVITAPNGFSIPDSIQTDAAINPGNSGGPLLDANGAVLGLNDQIETNNTNAQGEGSSSGVGFATPSTNDMKVANAIIDGRPVEQAYVGVSLAQGSAPGGGALIGKAVNGLSTVVPGSPAAKAGLKPGDIIVAVNGQPITSSDDFITMMTRYSPGQTVLFKVKQTNGNVKLFKVTLANRPKQAPTAG